MLPDAVLPVPASLMTLLAVFSSLFTAPSFRTFTMLACGRGPVPAVEPRPGALLLLPRPLEPR
jgi:hypothetical protein